MKKLLLLLLVLAFPAIGMLPRRNMRALKRTARPLQEHGLKKSPLFMPSRQMENNSAHRLFSDSKKPAHLGERFTWNYLASQGSKKKYLYSLLQENLGKINMAHRVKLSTYMGDYDLNLHKESNPEQLIKIIAQEGLIHSDLFDLLGNAQSSHNANLIRLLLSHGAKPNHILVKKILVNQFNISPDQQVELIALCLHTGVKANDEILETLLYNLHNFNELQQTQLIRLLFESNLYSHAWLERILENEFKLEPSKQELIVRLLIASGINISFYCEQLLKGHFSLTNHQRERFIALFIEKGARVSEVHLENIITNKYYLKPALQERLLHLLLTSSVPVSQEIIKAASLINDQEQSLRFLSILQPHCNPVDLYYASQTIQKNISSLEQQLNALSLFNYQQRKVLKNKMNFYQAQLVIMCQKVKAQECSFTSPSGQTYKIVATSVKDIEKIVADENKEPECNTPLEKELYELHKRMKQRKLKPEEIINLTTLEAKTVKIAYYKLMQKYHPDKFNGSARLQKAANEVASEINRAYDALKKI